MNINELFLDAIRASLEGETVAWQETPSLEDWQYIIRLASEHNVMPMIYQSIYASPSFTSAVGLGPVIRRNSMLEVSRQIMGQQEFLSLYQGLSDRGYTPIVVKGAILRNVYINGDNRVSGDEDFFIPTGTYDAYKIALAECDMSLAEWDVDCENSSHEVTYLHEGGILRIEIHKDLFDKKLSAYKGMNTLFKNAFEKSIFVDIDGVKVRTMNHSDHMLFLILHAFKHFVGSGFGIRQVCDMVVYGNHYGKEIDWEYLLRKCREIHTDLFAAAIFDIGHQYLGFDWNIASYPKVWQEIKVDSSDLLADLLDAGVYGASDMNRKHSSNMTLHAVSAEREGGKARFHLLKTLFPSIHVLRDRYTYLQRFPFLLPVAWMQRIWKYKKENQGSDSGSNAAESVRIGQQRVALLKEYGIIEK